MREEDELGIEDENEHKDVKGDDHTVFIGSKPFNRN